MRSAKVASWFCVMTLALSSSCGSDKRVPRYSASNAGPKDAATQRDAGGKSASDDAGEASHAIYSGKTFLCSYGDADMSQFVGSTANPELASATDERGYALLHHDDAGNLWIEALPIDGDAQAPVVLLDASEQARSISIAANGLHFLVAWHAPGEGADSLRTRELSSTAHQPTTLSERAVAGSSGGALSALIALGDGFLAAFLASAGGGPELDLQRLLADGTLDGGVTAVPGVGARSPEDLHLALLDGGGVLMAWLEHDSTGAAHVFSFALSKDLKASGDPIELSKNEVADAPFGLAGRSHSEGLIYHALDGSVRDAVKYRRIDPSGSAPEAVLNLVNAPGRARDASITAFGQGYAAAYRTLPSLGVDHSAVHVAFINQFGEVVYQAELAESTDLPGPTTIAATEDGHLAVGWSTQQPTGATTHALKLYCPGALVLCGGKVH